MKLEAGSEFPVTFPDGEKTMEQIKSQVINLNGIVGGSNIMRLEEYNHSVRRWELSSVSCAHVAFLQLHAMDMIQTCWVVTIKVSI